MYLQDKYKVAILSFSDGRDRVHKSLREAIRANAAELKACIDDDPLLEAIEIEEIANSSNQARKNAHTALRAMLDAFVFNIPVFAFPNYSLITARVLERPVLLHSPRDGALPGAGGILAAAGGMNQVGIKVQKVWGDPIIDTKINEKIKAHCRAAGALERLKGTVYGNVGGRSIGMNTGVPHQQDWMRLFGVDVDHVDQSEILRRAHLVDPADVENGYAWLRGNAASFCDSGKASPEHVKAQIRNYLATKDIIKEYGFSFLGIKCHFDMSEFYHTQCLSAMLLNDPYDWQGYKEPTPMACEADGDGALTMRILQLISGYPSMLFDVRFYNEKKDQYVFCNCGAQPSWYAARSIDPVENLKRVHVKEVLSKYAGNGAHFVYICKEGPFTLARLTRDNDGYKMHATTGNFISETEEAMQETTSQWPHGFAKLAIKPEDFIDEYGSNHAHVVPGDHIESLKQLCKMVNIPFIHL